MAQKRIKKALSPLRSYFDITILEPYKAIKAIKKENHIEDHSNLATYSIRELIKKQGQMTSPNTEFQTAYPDFGLRGEYLKSLNSNQVYVNRLR